MSGAGPFRALAAAMLDSQVARGGVAAVGTAFDSLASLACLDQMLLAGLPLEQTLPLVLDALRTTTGAAACRLLVRSHDGAFVRIRQDGSPGAETPLACLAGLAGAVWGTGTARALGPHELEILSPASDWLAAMPPATLLCAPLPDGAGVLQLFDSGHGGFGAMDRAIAEQCCAVLSPLLAAGGEDVGLTPAPSSDAASGASAILARILAVALRVLGADRGWILLHDPLDGAMLRSSLSDGLGGRQLQVSAVQGVAASAFRNGMLVNIAEAYQDPRFNPALDRLLGYRTRTVLCVPIDAAERRLGVLQLVNRRGGPFTVADEENAKALAAQVAVTVEHNALFEQISRMRAANESMLRSLSNGVLTLSEAGTVGFVNGAALRILRAQEGDVVGRRLEGVFDELNAWVLEAVANARAQSAEMQLPNSELYVAVTDEWVPVNLSILPLQDARGQPVGTMLVLEDLQREQDLRRAMSRYVSADIVERQSAGDPALLDGAIQPATILFSDIRGFSGLSEALGAQGTVALLNQYFTYMEDVVANRGGLIDKYIGDAVMAVFGIPQPGQWDAENAVQAATDMLQALAMLNGTRAAAGEAALRIGIGLATGPTLMGNIGSPKRMDLTVIGNPVNLASRLEGATKQYGADILLDGPTAARLRPGRLLRRIDVVRVLGQEQATELFEVLDHRAVQWGPHLHGAMPDYAAAMERYVAGDWADALALFDAAGSANPADKAATILAERCRAFLSHPPAEWDGVFRLTEK